MLLFSPPNFLKESKTSRRRLVDEGKRNHSIFDHCAIRKEKENLFTLEFFILTWCIAIGEGKRAMLNQWFSFTIFPRDWSWGDWKKYPSETFFRNSVECGIEFLRSKIEWNEQFLNVSLPNELCSCRWKRSTVAMVLTRAPLQLSNRFWLRT